MREAVFTAEGLTKTYVSGEVMVHALNDVDLEIAEKEVVVLLGPQAAARPRCSTSWAVSTGRRAAGFSSAILT